MHKLFRTLVYETRIKLSVRYGVGCSSANGSPFRTTSRRKRNVSSLAVFGEHHEQKAQPLHGLRVHQPRFICPVEILQRGCVGIGAP